MKVFSEIMNAFELSGQIQSIQPLTSGGIHQTYQIQLTTGEAYILQQMNTEVFQHPETVMKNLQIVGLYLKDSFPEKSILHFHQTAEGKYLYQNWRLMDCMQGYSLKTCENLEQIHQAGQAFGAFQKAVSKIPANALKSVITGFHDTKAYFQKLTALGVRSEEVERLKSWQKRACFVQEAYLKEKIPLRTVHYDMKCSNLLFDRETNQPLAVIDWDTIMSGMPVYDFGDAVRSFASNVSSSERDFNLVGLDMRKFKAFTSGWREEAELLPEEQKLLIPSIFSVTVELAVRYLTDYLQGNIYFKTEFPEQNLIRAKNQIKLAEEILKHQSEMENCL